MRGEAMSHTKIIPTQYGFEVELPKGKLAVDNVATFPYPHYGHFIQLRTDRQTLEVYASATGQMRVFGKRMANGRRIMETVELKAVAK